jgi:hypothetical protein
MTSRMLRVTSRMAIAMTAALIGACGGGPSQSEFVSACLAEGQNAVNAAFTRELGVEREAFCGCAGEKVRSSLSADGQRAMILEMQGKSQEAAEISSKMSESEQQAFAQGALEVFAQCAEAAGAE